MSLSPNDPLSDDDLKAALGAPSIPDFDAWRERHAEAVAYLNPVVTRIQQRKQRILMRTLKLTAMTLCLGVLIWLVGFRDGTPAYAQALKSLKEAETVTWTTTWYNRATSLDEKRTWMLKYPQKNSYRHPGLYREERYDQHGVLRSIEIRDTVSGQHLALNVQEKQARLSQLTWTDKKPQGPFAGIEASLSGGSIEFLGRKKRASAEANVFQKVTPATRDSSGYSEEFWVDPQTKQLIEHRSWNTPYDPDTAADRDVPAEKTWSKFEATGVIQNEIALGAKLDPELFSLQPPAGYTLDTIDRPTVTEEEIIEYLGTAAKFNGGTFYESPYGIGVDQDQYNAIFTKEEKDWTATEKAMVEQFNKYLFANLNRMPTHHFVDDHTEKDSFRYIGKGVKLGDADRIICWYKLKNSGQYRAVYGDLQVKDIEPKDLPLEVK